MMVLWHRWRRARYGDRLAKAYGMGRKLRRRQFWARLRGIKT